ncbi:MAG TPA: methyltransferase domain-containing protein [Stellaceae bacterium]|nr:methyltransferase domain-containing protein [Stellaceae bacterium]
MAAELYRGILGREPDPDGLADKARQLRAGLPLHRLIRGFLESDEYRSQIGGQVPPSAELPNLIEELPDRYAMPEVRGGAMPVYLARGDDDIVLMEQMIEQHLYYDKTGVWSPLIDLDKHVTAAIVRGLGARSCFELGCFTGPVLSLLAGAGIDVLGSEVSHSAFTFAYPNARRAMRYGDLLTLAIDRRFDVVLCMDVLEHVSPLRLDSYMARLAALIEDDGYLYLNAPMWGRDRVYGEVEDQYIDEWRQVGDAAWWRHWPCDNRGWPVHGHLVWASPIWWEENFARHGLVRDITIERAIHQTLAGFFAGAPGRRSLFVLRRPDNRRPSVEIAAAVSAGLAPLTAAAR